MNDCKILLVEDAPHWRKILRICIQTALDHLGCHGHIGEAENLEQAWDMLENGSWDLLCTDIGLSEASGENEGALLVSRSSERNIPTIIISGTPAVTPQHVRDFLKEQKVADFFYKQSFNRIQFIGLVKCILYPYAMPNVIIFYDNSDSDDVKEIKKIMSSNIELESNKIVIADFDEKLTAKFEWHESIVKSPKSIIAAILMISADFLASHSGQSTQLPSLVKKLSASGVRAIPVYLAPCDIQYAKRIFDLEDIEFIGSSLMSSDEEDQAKILHELAKQTLDAIINSIRITK